jgi:hypothetical protein
MVAFALVILGCATTMSTEVLGAEGKKELHPCVVCSPEELAGLKARLNSPEEPYNFWRSNLEGGASWKGGISSGFSALLCLATGEKKYRDLAAGALAGVAGERWSQWSGGGTDWGLDASRDFMMIFRGYDLMKGMGALTPEEDARIRDALYEKANELYFLFDQIGNPNNHELRAASSLGVAGMVLADYEVRAGSKPEIVFRADFEDAAADWEPAETPNWLKQKFGVSREAAHGGQGSFHYWSDSAWRGFRSPDLPMLEAEKDYTLTFWVRGEKAGHLPVVLAAGKYAPRIAQPIIPAGQWTEYCATFRIPKSANADLSKCHLVFSQGEGHSNSNWYIDDVTLYSGRQKHTPEEFLTKADKHIAKILVERKLVSPEDFAYAEGPGYGGYTSELLIPFLNAYRVFAGKEHAVAPLAYGYMRHTALARRPWGALPNIGDGDGGYAYSRLSFLVNSRSGLYDGALFRWNWRTGQETQYQEYGLGWHTNDLPELFGGFIVEGKASPPDVRCLLGPKHNYQVFRSGWEPSAVYMLLQAKHYPGGGSHAQADAGSFMIDAFGSELTIDCGYGGWGNPNRVPFYTTPMAHNLILIGGKGPLARTPAAIAASLESEFADYTEINMEYESCSVTRRILFPGHRYFVIADTVEAKADVDCDWLVHSPGTEAKVAEDEMSWVSGKAGLLVRFATPVKIERRVGKRCLPAPIPPGSAAVKTKGDVDHAYFLCRRSGKKVAYLSMLFPTKQGDKLPEVEVHSDEGSFAMRVKFDGVEDVAIFSDRQDAAWGGVATTAPLAFVRLSGGQNWAFLRGPGILKLRNAAVLDVKGDAKTLAVVEALR